MFTCARRSVRRLVIFAALAFAAIPPAAASADLQFTSTGSPVPFPDTTVGQMSQQTLHLTNTSTSTSVNITGQTITGPGANQFALGPALCPPTLGPSASCNLDVRFNPSQTGSFTAQIEVANNSAPNPLIGALSGTGVAPDLTFSPTALDFGLVDVDDSQGTAQPVTIQNNGAAPTQISQIDINGPGSSAFHIDGGGCQPQMLAVGQSCSQSIRFEPMGARNYNATLHARVGGFDFTAALTGVGGIGDLVVAPSTVDFGRVLVGGSATATVTARSSGNAPFDSLVAFIAGPNVGDLRVVRDLCSLRVLVPSQQCSVTVRFSPSVAGPAEGALALVGDDEPHVAMLRGEGVSRAPARRSPRRVRVVFARKSHSARIRDGRINLGRARCKGAPACRVTARTKFVAKLGASRRPYLVRGSTRRWNLPRNRALSIPVPHGMRGTPSRVILTMRTRAAGHRSTVARRALGLIHAKH